MTDSKMPELLPCPFCGGKAELWRASADRRRSAWIACMGRCAVLITKEHATDDDAIAAWSRRADLSHPAPVADAELEALAETAVRNWLGEMEGFATRGERFFDAVQAGDDMMPWLIAAAATALRARTAPVRAGKVKALVWRKKAGGFFAEADTGTYRAFAPNGGIHFMWMRYSSWPRSGVILGLSGDTFDTAFPTLEAAKAAAQADYEQRILSAILPEGGA